MVIYRHFRNTDPPALVRVWNEALTGRGAVRLPSASLLEQQVFSKPYFDPAGLILAEEDGQVVGFGHAGFGPDAAEERLSTDSGVVCTVAVVPGQRRRGIGSGLLRRCEEYLRGKGAGDIFAGPNHPHNPFYRGLYGGSDLPGFLLSDTLAEPFLTARGYRPCRDTVVFQRHVQEAIRAVDARFVSLRQKYEIVADAAHARPTWWENCGLGVLEPLEFQVLEKSGGGLVAEALLMELEGFSARWHAPAVGVFDMRVEPEFRRQGLAKFLLVQVLRFIQEQCFELIELHAPASNEGTIALCEGLGFDRVDVGRVYQREPAPLQ